MRKLLIAVSKWIVLSGLKSTKGYCREVEHLNLKYAFKDSTKLITWAQLKLLNQINRFQDPSYSYFEIVINYSNSNYSN